jgi:UDP-2,3-diacylglucosamine pyrophosphatase LpxH
MILIPPIESKKTVIVSDVHFGYSRCDHEAFLDFINTYPSWNDVDHFVLLGDTFDFWRRQNAKVLVENKEIIDRILSLQPRIMFVRGNHDYYLQDAADRFYKLVDLPSRSFGIGQTISIKSGGKEFVCTHGYELEVFSSSWLEPLGLDAYEAFCELMCRSEDKSGSLASWIYDVISEIFATAKGAKGALDKLLDPAEERELDFIDQVAKSNSKNILLGLPREAVLVFGHTHHAFECDGVVNSGSWVVDPKKEAHNYVEICDGDYKLKPFPQTKDRLEEVGLEIKRATKALKRRRQRTRASRSRKPHRR